MSDKLDTNLLIACLNAQKDAVLVTDARLDQPGPAVVYANPAFTELTGYSLSEIRGKTPRVLQGPRTSRRELSRLRRCLDNGEDFTGEVVNYRKDGTPFWLSWSITAYPDAANPTHYIAVQRDVTEQRELTQRAERLETLHDLERTVATTGLNLSLLRDKIAQLVMDATHADGAAVEEIDEEYMLYTAVCGTAKDSLGLRLPVDKSISGACARERKPIYCADVRKDVRVARKTAEKLGFRSGILVPLLHEDTCFGVILVYSGRPSAFKERDIDLLTRASAVLAASLYDAQSYETEKQRRSAILDSLPMLVSYVDTDLVYREVNTAYLSWFGLSAEKVIGHKVEEVLGQRVFSQVENYLHSALAGSHVSFELHVPFKDGSDRPIEADYIPHLGSHGAVEGVYVLVRDISDRHQAEHDYLTARYNRRAFEKQVNKLFEAARRYERPLSLIFLDLDHFKDVNDKYGHQAGDEVLKFLGQLLDQRARQADVVARWGGEEFAILAPETNLDEAREFAEDLRESIRSATIEPVGKVTASFGISQLQDNETQAQMIARADNALYQAKADGRDCVRTAD